MSRQDLSLARKQGLLHPGLRRAARCPRWSWRCAQASSKKAFVGLDDPERLPFLGTDPVVDHQLPERLPSTKMTRGEMDRANSTASALEAAGRDEHPAHRARMVERAEKPLNVRASDAAVPLVAFGLDVHAADVETVLVDDAVDFPVTGTTEVDGGLVAAAHPWPTQLMLGWGGSRDKVEVVRVEPTLTVEVLADAACDGGRWRHVTRCGSRWRPDTGPAGVGFITVLLTGRGFGAVTPSPPPLDLEVLQAYSRDGQRFVGDASGLEIVKCQQFTFDSGGPHRLPRRKPPRPPAGTAG